LDPSVVQPVAGRYADYAFLNAVIVFTVILHGTSITVNARFFFFFSNSGGGVQLGPLGTSATNWPTVSAPGDTEDGEFGEIMIGRANRNTLRKPAPVPLCPPQISHGLTGREPGRPLWEASD
jgi:hypothetical protein